MNLFRKNFTLPTKILLTTLLLQFLMVSNTQAVDVSINGSENLILMNDILFDYASNPKVIEFDILNPFVCSNPLDNPNPTTILNVNNILNGNNVLAAEFDVSNNLFKVNTARNIQCATELGVYNDVIFKQGLESSGNNIEIVLKDLATGFILNSASNIELYDGQLYQYKYEIRNTSPANISVDVLENYLTSASPTFIRDGLESWDCEVISGAFSNCGANPNGIGYVSLDNAVIGAFGQLSVVVTRRVKVDNAGPIHRLDLLAAAFLNNGVYDSNPLNNIAYTSFGTTVITATSLNFTSQPTNTVAGQAISNLVVELRDAEGIVDANNSGLVTISIDQTSPSGGTLSGTVTKNAVRGIATFSGLNIDKSGSGYRLKATSLGLTQDLSNTFNITPAAATQLQVFTQPQNAVAETIMTPVIVHALDDFGNIATNYSSRVFANIKSGDGNLSGTTNPFANAGVATFNNLSINLAGTGYTLQFSSGTLEGAISDPFEITAVASASNSVFGVDISQQVAGTNVTYVAIIRDANGNPVGAGVPVSFMMSNSGGSNTPNLSCTTAFDGSCSVQSTSTVVGTTIVSASISDGNIPNIRIGFFDNTSWVAGEADPSLSNFGAFSDTANTNTSVDLVAELRDQYGNLVPGETVSFEFVNNGATTAPGAFCGALTSINGLCNSSVQSSTAGTTTIRAFFGNPSTEIINSNGYDNGQNVLGKSINWIVAPN